MTFVGSGSDPETEVVDYHWRSSIDGDLGREANLNASSLTPGNHTIYFRVRSDDDFWSKRVSACLTINDTTPPVLRLHVATDFANGTLTVAVRANENLSVIEVIIDNGSSRAPLPVVVTPDTPGDRRNFSGNHAIDAPGNYRLTATGIDEAGHVTTAAVTAAIVTVTTAPGQPRIINCTDTAGARLVIFSNGTFSGDISVSRVTYSAPLQDETALTELGIYVSIDISDELLAGLDYINISVAYDPAVLPSGVHEQGLKIYRFIAANHTWVRLSPQGVDTAGRYVWGHVTNFSIFGVFGSNVAPVADAGSDFSVALGTPARFAARATDIDGFIVRWEWDFDGDGLSDWSSIDPGEASLDDDGNWVVDFVYPARGEYTVTLKVTDDKNGNSFDQIIVTVGDDEPGSGAFEPTTEALAAAGGLVVIVVAVIFFLRRRKKQD